VSRRQIAVLCCVVACHNALHALLTNVLRVHIKAWCRLVALYYTRCSVKTLGRVYTRTHVALKHVSRTSNLYPDTYMSTDTCRRIQAARPGYMLTVSRWQLVFIYVTVDLYPFVSSNRRATNWRQFFCRYKETCWRRQVDTTRIRQHVSWCKRGITVYFYRTSLLQNAVKRML